MVRAIVGLFLIAVVASSLGRTALQSYNEICLWRAPDDASRQRYLQLRRKYHSFQQFAVSLFFLSGLTFWFLR